MDETKKLPAGWMETEHGVFWREGAQGSWFSMETAPRTGAPFVWLRPTFVIGPGRKRRVEMTVSVLHRKHHDCESGGYWYGPACSFPDDSAKHGWWAHSASMTKDGRLVMPKEALDYILERSAPALA